MNTKQQEKLCKEKQIMQHYDLVPYPFDIKFFFAISFPSSSFVSLAERILFIIKKILNL